MKSMYIASISLSLISSGLFASADLERRKEEVSARVQQLRQQLIEARYNARKKNLPGYDSYEGPDVLLAQQFEAAVAEMEAVLAPNMDVTFNTPTKVSVVSSRDAAAGATEGDAFVAAFCAARGARAVVTAGTGAAQAAAAASATEMD